MLHTFPGTPVFCQKIITWPSFLTISFFFKKVYKKPPTLVSLEWIFSQYQTYVFFCGTLLLHFPLLCFCITPELHTSLSQQWVKWNRRGPTHRVQSHSSSAPTVSNTEPCPRPFWTDKATWWMGKRWGSSLEDNCAKVVCFFSQFVTKALEICMKKTKQELFVQ